MVAVLPFLAMPFATPDFGAGATVLGVLALIWLAVLVGVLGGAIRAVILIRRGSSAARRTGIILLLVIAAVPLSCCFGPSLLFRLNYGSFPLSGNPYARVKDKMSPDEVRVALGNPHNREKRDDGEHWYYYQDSFQIGWFCVDFDPDGLVKGTHGW